MVRGRVAPKVGFFQIGKNWRLGRRGGGPRAVALKSARQANVPYLQQLVRSPTGLAFQFVTLQYLQSKRPSNSNLAETRILAALPPRHPPQHRLLYAPTSRVCRFPSRRQHSSKSDSDRAGSQLLVPPGTVLSGRRAHGRGGAGLRQSDGDGYLERGGLVRLLQEARFLRKRGDQGDFVRHGPQGTDFLDWCAREPYHILERLQRYEGFWNCPAKPFSVSAP